MRVPLQRSHRKESVSYTHLDVYKRQPCTAVVEESHNDNLFQLTPSATAVESIQYDNAFRMCFSDPNQGSASADYIADNNLAKKVAVI